jgi:hypothetical protein
MHSFAPLQSIDSKGMAMNAIQQGGNALFILLGAVMVLAMHAGFAFLELGTVRRKNQVNALVKILVDFSVSTVVYFALGYSVAYGTGFFVGAEELAAKNGYALVKFFFLLTFAAAIPAIISGCIAERAKFWPQLLATAIIVGLIYPILRASPGTSILGFRLGCWPAPVRSFTTLPAAWWCTRWAVGSRWVRSFCWVRVAIATARTAPSRPTRRPAFPSWRWVPGF